MAAAIAVLASPLGLGASAFCAGPRLSFSGEAASPAASSLSHLAAFDSTSPVASALASPAELVRTAVANEVAAAHDTSVKHMFLSRKQTAHGSQTRLYAETREAMVAMTIAYNDQPITAQQLQGEEGRLDGIRDHPEQMERKKSQEKEDAERTLRMVKALPDAFLYEYDGTEESAPGVGKAGDSLVRLKFRPNPGYVPPSRVEQVLAGMQGFVLVDPEAKRIAKIDATLLRDVSFGWGFFGRLAKGGTFLVEQADVGDGTWDTTRMRLGFTGTILLVKSLNISSDETLSDFRRIPADTTFAKGVEMLKAEQARLAANRALGAATTGPKSQ
jgi:hypothetical protein